MPKKISSELLEILACPLCKGELIYDEKNSELICYQSKLTYSIKDGIPVMLIEEAKSSKAKSCCECANLLHAQQFNPN